MRRFDVSKVFQLFIIVFLFAFVGISILGSGQVFASGSSFNVPHVNDHFEKVQPGLAPTKETHVTPAPSKNTKPGLWDRFTTTCKNLWNKTKQTAVHVWQKTKEFCSKHEWLAGVLFWMTVITIAASFFKGEWDAVVDTVKGILDMLRHPILTLQNILYAFQHPVETGKAIWKVISESWERDVVHGNAKTRAHWLGYVVGQVVLSIVGTKGVDKVAEIGKAAAISRIARLNEAAKVSKVGRAARIVNGINRVQEGLRKLRIPQTISKVRGALSALRKTILGNKVAALVLTVVGLTTGILALDPEAFIQAFNKITVAAEKFEVKTAFKKAEKCLGYQPTPKYFASVNEPFFKCFYAPDGQGGGGTSKPSNRGGAKNLTAQGYAQLVSNRIHVVGHYREGEQASVILRDELKLAGVEPPPYPNAAHHIVPWKDSRAREAQQLLKEFGIDENSAANGVFLPYVDNEDPKGKYVGDEALHRGNHSREYIEYVTSRLREVRDAGGTTADAVNVLNDIRAKLLNGSLSLN